jgi:anaerobic magnesium-protoporphyrin IX monomethyl ester cyclase
MNEDPKEQRIMRPYPPLGLLYLAAYLDQHSIANELFDTTFSNMPALQSHLLKTRPAVAGIYVNLMTKLNVIKLISFIREHIPNTRVVLGGPEVRSSAERFLRCGADCIIIGEGEETMLEVAQGLLTNQAVNSSIKGIAYLDDTGEFVQTPER